MYSNTAKLVIQRKYIINDQKQSVHYFVISQTMTDRYQPGTSLLSFLNPRSMYYREYVPAAVKLTETKAELAGALVENNKNPAEVLKITPADVPAVAAKVEDAPVPVKVATAVEPGAVAAPAETPVIAAAAVTPAAAAVEVPETAIPKQIAPPATLAEAKANAQTVADTAAPVAVVAETGKPVDAAPANKTDASLEQGAAVLAAADAVAKDVKEETKAVAADVAKDAAAPGVEAKGAEAAKVEAAVDAKVTGEPPATPATTPAPEAVAAPPAEKYCPCQYIIMNKKKAQKKAETTGEQAKNAVESFLSPQLFAVGKGPSKLLSNIEVAGVSLKEILTGADKPPEKKDDVETFCDNNWHGIASTIVVLLSLVIMIVLCLGVFGLLHIVFDIRKGPNPNFNYNVH